MYKIKNHSKQLLFVVVAALLVFMALPASHVSAAGLGDDSGPLDRQKDSDSRLEHEFHRLQRQVGRQTRLLDQSDRLVERAQSLIDKADEKELDPSAVQTALDNLVVVLLDVKAAHAEVVAIAGAHVGFDAEGKVIDPDEARGTIQELRTALQETREEMDGTGRALLQAIREFLEANRDVLRPERTPEP